MDGRDGRPVDDRAVDPVARGAARAAVIPDFAMTLRGYDRFQVDDYLERQQRWAVEVEARLADAQLRAEAGETAASGRQARLGELEAKQAEDADGPPRSMKALGERVGRILQTAWDAGEEVREEVVAAARAEAAEVERRAAERESEAARILDEARRRAAEVTAEADEVRRLAESEAAQVSEQAEGTARARAAELVAEAEAEAGRVRSSARAEADRTIEQAERRRDELEEVIRGLTDRRDAALGELDRVRAALEQVVAVPGVPSPPPPAKRVE